VFPRVAPSTRTDPAFPIASWLVVFSRRAWCGCDQAAALQRHKRITDAQRIESNNTRSVLNPPAHRRLDSELARFWPKQAAPPGGGAEAKQTCWRARHACARRAARRGAAAKVRPLACAPSSRRGSGAPRSPRLQGAGRLEKVAKHGSAGASPRAAQTTGCSDPAMTPLAIAPFAIAQAALRAQESPDTGISTTAGVDRISGSSFSPVAMSP
jgi:hypothetical protein